jgi:hypothetical protein
MSELFFITADNLRAVRKAQQHFLALWAVDCLLMDHHGFDRLADDVENHPPSNGHSSEQGGWSITN